MFPSTSTYDVRGRVVLVTGAGSGIGAATSRELHRRGASLCLVDIDATAVQHLADELGERALSLAADVRERARMTQVVDEVTQHFGRLDVVVANAGIAPDPATIRTVDPKEFDRVVDVNLTGVFNTVRPAIPHVVGSGGHVVVVASAAAFVPGAGLAPYMVSKSGVEALGRALRIELAAAGASAGVAYFGFVNTALARPLDDDPLGADLQRLLPGPLSSRISPEHAGSVIADGIARRSPATYAPQAWFAYSILRGGLNIVVDRMAARSSVVQGLVRSIEDRIAQDGARS